MYGRIPVRVCFQEKEKVNGREMRSVDKDYYNNYESRGHDEL